VPVQYSSKPHVLNFSFILSINIDIFQMSFYYPSPRNNDADKRYAKFVVYIKGLRAVYNAGPT